MGLGGEKKPTARTREFLSAEAVKDQGATTGNVASTHHPPLNVTARQLKKKPS